jgi:LPXTG-motif cell wall-anchored protein
LQSDTILIGKQTDLIIDISSNKQIILKSFPIWDSLPKEIEILDSIRTSDSGHQLLKLQITSFTPGSYPIPSLPLVFTFENTTDTIYSANLRFTVLSPEIINQAEIRDIKPPKNLPFKLIEILPETSIILGGLILLILLILYFFRKRRKKRQIEEVEKELPPHVVAFRELDRLKSEKLWQNGKTKEYYSQLSDIFRKYLEKRFEIPALENVSSGTLETFRKRMPQEDMLYSMMESILLTSDMVKFAKADPLPSDNQGNMDNAYLFVGQTKVEEVTSIEQKLEQTEKEIAGK